MSLQRLVFILALVLTSSQSFGDSKASEEKRGIAADTEFTPAYLEKIDEARPRPEFSPSLSDNGEGTELPSSERAQNDSKLKN